MKLDSLVSGKKYFKYLLAALSAVLVWIPMVVPELFLLSWIGLVPFLFALFTERKGFFVPFKIFFIYGLIYYLLLYTWFYSLHPLSWQGMNNTKSFLIITLLWAAISLAQSLQWSVNGVFYRILNPKGIWKAITVPFIWIFIEWLQELTIWGMPWGRIAVSQSMFLPGIQSVSLLGSLFLSGLIVAVNSLLAYGIKHRELVRTVCLVALGIFCANSLFGLVRLAVLNNRKYERTVKVAAIQGNLPSFEKWINEGRNAYEVFMRLSEEAAEEGAEIIMWPESAVPIYIHPDGYYDQAYKQLAEDYGVYLVAGGFITRDEKSYSSLVMYGPDGSGGVNGAYRKRHLVPFGEFVPYKDFIVKILPFLNDFTMLGSDLTQSDESIVFDTEYGKMSGLICFDSIFSKLAGDDVRNGSELILIGTNDSYYDKFANPFQHNSHAVLRAVEYDRFVVRAANTGLSSIISPDGKVAIKSNMHEECYISGQISFNDTRTLYSYVGDLVVYLSMVYILFGLIWFNRGFFARIIKRKV